MPHRRAGSSVWQIRVRGVRQSAGTDDYDAAKALEQRLNAQAWAEERMGIKPPRTWQECVARWARERSGKRSWDTDAIRLRWLHAHFGDVADVRLITRDSLHAILVRHRPINEASAAPANSTANRIVALVQAILNAACREWDWLERSPKLRTYPEPEGRQEWLTPAQWRSLEAELPEHLRRPATFALATGLRLEKVFGLRWSEVDLERQALTVAGTRNKLGVTIPLNATAMGVLTEIRSSAAVHIDRVFTWRGRPLQHYGLAWDRAKGRAGVDITWHGLRHTWASWMAQAGVPEEIRQRLGGWARRVTSDRYTHLDIDWLRPFAARVDATIASHPPMPRAEDGAQVLEETGVASRIRTDDNWNHNPGLYR